MAVGVSCAGTGMRSALDLLAPLLTDAVDFVRQGALIANALVLMQQPESKVCCLLYSQHRSCIVVPGDLVRQQSTLHFMGISMQMLCCNCYGNTRC